MLINQNNRNKQTPLCVEHRMVQKLEQHEHEIDLYSAKPPIPYQLSMQSWGGKSHYEIQYHLMTLRSLFQISSKKSNN